MAHRTVIPFGPQHPVLPEPLHLDLVLEDETIVDAIPSIGYIHRGLELLVSKRDYHEYVFVAERICGICSFMHGMGYSLAVEKLLNVEVPKRAGYIRIIYSELERIHSHLLWLGLAADAFGFENLFMQSWRSREYLLDVTEACAGGRVIFGACKVGGVRGDLEPDMVTMIRNLCDKLEKDIKPWANVFIKDYTVQKRLRGVGVLSKDNAHALGAVGPMLRASGIGADIRLNNYIPYDELDWDIKTHTDGDCYARAVVRIEEVYESLKIVRQALDKLPEGPFDVKVTGNPTGETYMRVEQPRGEVVYYVCGNGTKNLETFRARTPTFANIPPLVTILKGADLSDVPTIVLTIDPCISCTER